MQRMGAASRNTVGEIRSYGDEGGHFQITNFSAAIVGGTNTMFTVPVAKSGRYIFEGFVLLANTLTETVSMAIGMSYPGASPLSMTWGVPTGAFSAAGQDYGYNFSTTNGGLGSSLNIAFSAGDLRPLWIYGGLRITDGTPPGNISLIATKTAGAGNLQFGTYSRFFVQNMEP
jgi:hypothetical protein